MLKLWGKLYRNQKTIRMSVAESEKDDMSAALLDCMEQLTHEFDLEMPIWQSSHTKQLGLFRKAVFRPGDFMDAFPYEKFEIQILDK